jgi:hypothetical protein
MHHGIDQIAREIADTYPCAVNVFDAAQTVLRRHWPAPTVVEVTGEELFNAVEEAWANGRLAWSLQSDGTQKAHNRAAAILNANATPPVSSIGRIVHRPTTEVSTLVVPEDVGVEVSVFVVTTCHGKGVWEATRVDKCRDEVARWSADGITWHSRTTTTEPREWQARDVGCGVVVSYNADGSRSVYDEAMGRSYIAAELNRINATHIIVLPATLDGGK